MVRLKIYLILILCWISWIDNTVAQPSPLSPLWTKWEQEGWHCVTDWGGDSVSFSYVGGSSRSGVQVEFNGGTGRLGWTGEPFNLIEDWADRERDHRVKSFSLPPGPPPPNPCSAYEWSGWCYVNRGERTLCGSGTWDLGRGQISDVRGWRRFDYLGYMLSDSFYPGPGWWYADFGGPIQDREYIFYIPPTPDGIAKVVVQVEPDLVWWNSYNPSSGDYKINDTVAKEGTRLRFELGDMGTGKIPAALGFTPSAERFATEDITWGGGKWRWRSEYTYKHLSHYGAYLLNRVANIHSSNLPIYPSLHGEEDSKTGILYPEIWIRPMKVDVQIREAVTWNHIRHLRQVDPYKVEWDGKDDNSDIVPKGLYSIRVILPPDSTHEYYDSLKGGISIGPGDGFNIYGWASATQPDKMIFGYAGTSTDILNQPKDCYVYMNLYDDEFRLIKKLLKNKEIDRGEVGYISWDYRPYSPGTYYWTVWGEDSLGNQAHVSAGTFTVPLHIIQGIREPYPKDEPGWDKEGPIVRVRRPAVVMFGEEEIEFALYASKAYNALNGPLAYKTVMFSAQQDIISWEDIQGTFKLSGKQNIFNLLEDTKGALMRHLAMFYYSGHAIENDPKAELSDIKTKNWFLDGLPYNVSPGATRPTYLFPDVQSCEPQPKFVFLDACQTYKTDWLSVLGNGGYMGWKELTYINNQHFAYNRDFWKYVSIPPYSVNNANNKAWQWWYWFFLGTFTDSNKPRINFDIYLK